MEREAMEFDVVVVGAGPSGLAAAIRLRQLALEHGSDLSVCVIEKGSEVGAHILSGACIEPRALAELFPDWSERGAPLHTPVREDHFLYLTAERSLRLPTPPPMHNEGNFIVSLGDVCRWLGEQAEALGVEIYPGFAAAEVLHAGDGRVLGVATGDQGRLRDGSEGPGFQAGMDLRARFTVFAEGCRGSLTKQLQQRFALRDGVEPQTYGLGIKELWEIPDGQHVPGKVIHTIGWPLDNATYGGSWLYMFDERKVSVGFVVGLDYTNPYLSPFEEMQRYKTHKAIAPIFAGGRRLAYGARALSEGGFQSIPKLVFPGGAILGDAAGLLNVPKIKGTHTAMKSGIACAEALFEALGRGREVVLLDGYPARLEASWAWEELRRVRNIRPSFRWGLWPAIAYSALDTYLLRGRAPWTLGHHKDHESLRLARFAEPIAYPKPDGVLTFDRLSSVFVSNTNHEEDQPCHLQLADPKVPDEVNLPLYAGPEARYCPAGVYEYVESAGGGLKLQINAQNCVHCKTCDIKDPTQNINWVVPQGGGGPNYIGGM